MGWKPLEQTESRALTAAAWTAFVVVLLALAVFITPLKSGLLQGQLTAAMSAGRNLYVTLIQLQLPDHFDPSRPIYGWPAYGPDQSQYAFFSSTDLLRWLTDQGHSTIEFSYWGAPGIPRARTTNAVEFARQNNAWCVVADLTDEARDSTPFIFTRNIVATNTLQFTGPVADTLSDEAPFGRRAGVMTLKGGSSFTVRPAQTWEEVLDSPPSSYPVLRP